MDSNIYIEADMLQMKITQLREQKKNMEDALNSIKTDCSNMINYWSGSSGTKAYNALTNYTNEFQSIYDTLESSIAFIEKVLDSYKQMDALVNKKMQENANIAVY